MDRPRIFRYRKIYFDSPPAASPPHNTHGLEAEVSVLIQFEYCRANRGFAIVSEMMFAIYAGRETDAKQRHRRITTLTAQV